jgi:hypothetical protein
MKYIFCLIIAIFSFKEAKAQYFEKVEVVVGVGAGPETMISAIIPKLGFYKFDSLSSFQGFYGLETSIFIVGGIFGSIDAAYGIKKGPFTFETSLGYWYSPRTEGVLYTTGPSSHVTINPKFGLKHSGFWFRFGPSFIPFKNYGEYHKDLEDFPNHTMIGSVRYNFELLISPQFFSDYY